MNYYFDNIPQELKPLPQWVCFNYEERINNKGESSHTTKVLKIPNLLRNGNAVNAQANNPKTWRTFEETMNAYRSGKYDGMGFVLKAGGGYVFIDIDKCIDTDGKASEKAQQIVDKFCNVAYIERSVSGRGYHIICKGNIDNYINITAGRTGTKTGSFKIDGIKEIEVYQERRFLTFTGDIISGAPSVVMNGQDAIDWLFAEYPALNKRKRSETATKQVKPLTAVITLSENNIIDKIRQSEKGTKLARLLNGDISGYPSQSEADQAAMNGLCFWCGGDKELMRRIFSMSALGQRDKWQERKDYQDFTINKALEGWNGKCYDPAAYAKEKAEKELQEMIKQLECQRKDKLQAERLQEAFFCENTDAGNAERIHLFYGSDWLYEPAKKTFYKWNGKTWADSVGMELQQAAKYAFRLIIKAAEADEIQCDNLDMKAVILDYLKKCPNMSKIRPAIDMFKSMILTDGKEFDANPYLLNMPTKTLDLMAGEYHNHTRNDFITQTTTADASADYHGRLWDKTVREIMPDEPTRNWLQCFCGTFLCGDVSEELVLIAYGEGGRGKGTFFETIAAALGDYATTIPVEVILKSNQNSNGQTATPEIVKLKGKRLALCTESGTTSKLNEAKLKWLTGGDMLTARQLYSRSETFMPTHKLVYSTNYLPHVADATDSGLNRRLAIVTFNADIEPIRNNTLKAELRKTDNLADVIAWLLEGFKKWQSMGGLPEKTTLMLAAEGKFRSDNDIIGSWVKQCCDVGSEYKYNVTDALKAVNDWLSAGKTTNERITRREFTQLMERHGFKKNRNSNDRFFEGLKPVTKQ